MCRNPLGFDYQGYAYYCDFNQMLEIPLVIEGRNMTHLSKILERDLSESSAITGERFSRMGHRIEFIFLMIEMFIEAK